MADPLSFAASVVAVSNLAGTVASKGYRYLKAVKDCREDVRRLIAETNVLCGILTRLAVLLQDTKSGLDNSNGEAAEIDSGSETDDDEAEASNQPHGIPDFINECQKTLAEIEGILHRFGQSSTQITHSSQPTGNRSRYSLSALRKLDPKDLKWPLSKSKTFQLIETLERHKSTCTIALARDGLHGIHSVLEQTKLSNKHLAELRAKQETILKLQLNEVEEKAMTWLSPVNPTLKHQAFKRDRHLGTGTWLFDLPEMTNWLDSPKNALWIYGIPGAGKTTLSTLVVDEVLTKIRSECIGTAYFYVRHDDKDSHKLAHVIGSLISQLARQNPEVLADLMDWYVEYASQGPLTTTPEDQELVEKLLNMSGYFTETYIMIDGLDECGSLFDSCRERLIDAVASLSDNEDRSIRTLIFSRDAQDIRTRFIQMHFHTVSIAATSADLRLFTNSWLAKLNIRSEELKIEIVDTLVHEANGMFIWVRAQVDYLQRLPNDREKRSALKTLPPDLPQTYIRIFESIHITFPKKTTIYIQRLLRWLVLCKGKSVESNIYNTVAHAEMLSDSLRQAICIENDHDWLTNEEIPTLEQIHHWLGCLIRVTERHNEMRIELSHFTVREFLTMSKDNVSSPAVQQYLVDCSNCTYFADVCMTYLTHSHFQNVECSTSDEMETFLLNHPFYRYVAVTLYDHISLYNTDVEPNHAVQLFFCVPPSKYFMLWQNCSIWSVFEENASGQTLELFASSRYYYLSPLHFAAIAGLKNQIKLLFANNVDPNASSKSANLCIAPLHVAIASDQSSVFDSLGFLKIYSDCYEGGYHEDELLLQPHERSLGVVKLLVDSGANINQQLVAKVPHHQKNVMGEMEVVVTPLVLSLLCRNWRAASFLLDAGAKWDVNAEVEFVSTTDLCSTKNLLESFRGCEEVVERIVEFNGNIGAKDILEHWRRLRDEDESSHGSVSCSTTTDADPQEAFINAIDVKNWQEVRELLANHSGIEVNYFDQGGDSAVYCAANGDKDILLNLLEHGADPNLLTKDSYGALANAAQNGATENIRILLKFGADVEHIDPSGFTPLAYAVERDPIEAVQLLLDAGADVNAVLDDGSSALLVAIKNKNVAAYSALLLAGAHSNFPDNYGCSPLFEACKCGLEDLVRILLALPAILTNSLNAETIYLLNPVYIAARNGFDRIVKMLLDHGAEIDQGRPRGLGSPLLIACAYNHGAVVRLLLARGASLEVEGSRFGSAAGTARAYRNEGILNILEAHEVNPLIEEEDESIAGDISEPSGDENDRGDTQTAHDEENSEEPSDTQEVVETALSTPALDTGKPHATEDELANNVTSGLAVGGIE